MKSNKHMESQLQKCCEKGLIVTRTERNPYLKVSYKGAGKLVSPKWNIKIYTSGSVVCNDQQTLSDLIEDRIKPPDKSKILIQIDDAGIGFPLGGVLVGITDGSRVVTGEVPVRYFQNPYFDSQVYLKMYSQTGLRILTQEFKARPQTHRVEICTGHINTRLKEDIRAQGFDVRVVDIKGLLQDQLEDRFKAYILKLVDKDLGYDPKDFKRDKKALAKHYFKALNWGKKHAPHQLKTGWKAINGAV